MISLRRGASSLRKRPATSLSSLKRLGLVGRNVFMVLWTTPGMIGSKMAVAFLAVSSSLAVATAAGVGCCCAAAGGEQASQDNATAAAALRHAIEALIMKFLPMDSPRRCAPRS